MNTLSLPQFKSEVEIPLATESSVAALIPLFNSLPVSYALAVVGGLSSPSKMPSYGYSTSAFRCKVGSVLAKVEGSTCNKCYARKGNYTRFPKIQLALEVRYKSLSLGSVWVAAMVSAISRKVSKDSSVFRWHDSGDIQSVNHLRNIGMVMKFLPSVRGWLPTREYGMVDACKDLPSNLIVRASAHMLDANAPSRFPNSSIVLTDNSKLPDGASLCPAYTQGGECKDCRNCWDKDIAVIAYPKH
jgi:hypothetical protein